MKKSSSKFFIIFLLAIVTLLGGFFLLNKNSNNSKNKIIENAYVKNLTWETDISEAVVHSKGNLLEYIYIIHPKKPSNVTVNIKNLIKNLKVTDIELDGKKQDIDKTILESYIKEIATLKITGEALNNSDNKKNNKQDIKNNLDIKIKPATPDESEENNNTNKNLDKNTNKDNNSEKNSEDKKNNTEETKNIIAENISLNKYSFSSNIDNLVEISGNNLKSINYINIGGTSYTPISDDNKLYFNIEHNTFDSGEYFVLFELKNGKLLTLDKKINFKLVSSRINIANISPSSITNDKPKMIVLQGNGFNNVVSLQLSNNMIMKNTSFTIISDNVMSVQIPGGLPAGNYHFNIMDTEGINEIKEITFKITN